ncbi:cobalt-zinc-cadmium efflux system outer membrane protein [Dyadobacter jejuensis]|uniref:Cobalt-zinc-cadmium efflux system outer membrane protein n=1 Tax=Dyadobacter jejuensis TaxID=1082580 RepID=A0A316ASN9_9BACT|nr:TolC family protein [Dyadobacter jejuensis]PWJ60582.1 cobalt-zinc-cadmium efflux system outer membrane protein [Dyadobacter jejuensis]
MKRLILLFFSLSWFTVPALAQLTLQESEEAFSRNNLLLLAEQYHIDAAKAAIIQAKIWELPYLSGELNAVNSQNNRLFDTGKTGQKTLAIQQLIYLGGKKRNEVEFAKSNAELAELQFEQLLLSLRYQLKQHFYSLYFNQKKIEHIASQASRVDTLLAAYSIQVAKANLPLKDLVRLQSLSLNLQNDLVALQNEVISETSSLSLLTGLQPPFTPTVDSASLEVAFRQGSRYAPEELVSQAQSANPEYLSYLRMIENQELYLSWQQSLAKPDLTAGLSYDQRGGAFNNQVNLTLGIPLPFWNPNKGNIKLAQAQLAQAQLQKDYRTQVLRRQINEAYQKWEKHHKQYAQFATTTAPLDLVYDAVVENFRKGNIPMMEFTDFMESYNQSMMQINEMRKQLIISRENLNQLVNANVFL